MDCNFFVDQVMNFKLISYLCSSQKTEHFLEEYLAGWLISLDLSRNTFSNVWCDTQYNVQQDKKQMKETSNVDVSIRYLYRIMMACFSMNKILCFREDCTVISQERENFCTYWHHLPSLHQLQLPIAATWWSILYCPCTCIIAAPQTIHLVSYQCWSSPWASF